ncbi:MAG: tRNA 5-methoxyuridine(34)/uridine 5-oxyacetic acid(34) synthase CmoB [Candidatus Omnitrophica bacterium]|nr:tRNA 5-methoxyuridine(34)/uridine 5-oxyacetic acid(34) synthase CmoB [Candidatus Omnitrophota bacterium]
MQNLKFNNILPVSNSTRISALVQDLVEKSNNVIAKSDRGDIDKWLKVLSSLPDIKPSLVDLNSDSVGVGKRHDISDDFRKKLEDNLRVLKPWKKGPFNIFGIDIDTEWRSDLKWERLKNHIKPLQNRLVLDVGCGSGYHLWRMEGCGAKLCIGIEPMMISVMQFLVLQKYIQSPSTIVFPLGVDDIPKCNDGFDTIFSMGLLYHRKSPLDHLTQLFELLADKGELVLETLIIEGKKGEVLAPIGRYAQMSNVWFIPSIDTLEYWLVKTGFKNIRVINVSRTTKEEQHLTAWTTQQSLMDYLDPNNPDLTVEGYPAPQRAIFICNR